MSPALPREERDAIRAVLGRGWVRCDVCLGVSPSWDGHEPGCSEWARERLTALLDALDAADILAAADEQACARLRELLAEQRAATDAARAEVAALRGRIERMADSLDRLASNAPSTYAGIRHTIAGELRALAAAPSEMEEGR